MKDVYLDIHLELDADALSRESEPDRFVIEALRSEADAKCQEAGARLRTDRAPEIIVSRGVNRVTKQLCVLIAARWAVVAPEDVPVRRAGEPLPGSAFGR